MHILLKVYSWFHNYYVITVVATYHFPSFKYFPHSVANFNDVKDFHHWCSNQLFHKKQVLNGSSTVVSSQYAILNPHVNICSNFYYTHARCVLNHIPKCQISARKKAAGIKETTTYICSEAFAVTECDNIFSGWQLHQVI